MTKKTKRYYRVPNKNFGEKSVLIRTAESQVRNFTIDHEFELVNIVDAGYMAETDTGGGYFVTCYLLKKEDNWYHCYTMYDPECEGNDLAKFISKADDDYAFETPTFEFEGEIESCIEDSDLTKNRFLF